LPVLPSPFAHRYLTREPTADEVLGEYELKGIHLNLIDSELSDRIRDSARGSSIILKDDGTALMIFFPVLEEVGIFRYEFKGLNNLKAFCRIQTFGGMSSNSAADHYQSVYGLRFVETAQAVDKRTRPSVKIKEDLFVSSTFTGNEKLNDIIFSFDDLDLGQILVFSKETLE
jgi:hypothetical protein